MTGSSAAIELAAISWRDADAPARFVASLRETGFGVLVDHPIPTGLVETIYAEWLGFFRSEAKHRYPRDAETQDGYFSTTTAETAKGHVKRDLKEYFHLFPWGRYPAEVSDAARQYRDLAADFAAELLGWIEAHIPAEVRTRFSMPLGAMIKDSPASLLRVLHYPPITGEEEAGAVRAAAHQDINLLTLLPAANQRGLQLLTSTRAWADVPCDFGTLVVNVGDMLQEASGGYFRSTTHRVVNPGDSSAKLSRVSLPFFLQPHPGVVLSERYTAGSYLAERIEELKGTRT